MPTSENTNATMIKDPEELAMSAGGTGSSSFIYLFLHKVPVINKLVPGESSSSLYSGSPVDYLDKFVMTVNYFPSWPAAGVNWAKDIIKKKGVEGGIVEITKALVDDTLGYQKTKKFKQMRRRRL